MEKNAKWYNYKQDSKIDLAYGKFSKKGNDPNPNILDNTKTHTNNVPVKP